jgi:hypothetical protein
VDVERRAVIRIADAVERLLNEIFAAAGTQERDELLLDCAEA